MASFFPQPKGGGKTGKITPDSNPFLTQSARLARMMTPSASLVGTVADWFQQQRAVLSDSWTTTATAMQNSMLSVAQSYLYFGSIGRPWFTDFTALQAITSAYQVSPVVYSCVRRIADEASVVPLILQKKDKGGEWINQPDSEIERLLEFPNPFKTRAEVLHELTVQILLSGNAFLHKVRAGKNNDILVELWNMNPDSLKPIPDDINFITGYQFYRSGTIVRDKVITPLDLIHIMFPDPSNPFWGQAPLRAAGKMVDVEVDAINWWKVSLQNRCIKDGLLSFKRTLTKVQWQEIRDQLYQQSVGSANARGPMVLGEDATYTPFSLTPAEMDFINSLKFAAGQIAMVFGVPPILLSDYESTNYASAEMALEIFWQHTMIPYLALLCSCLSRSLLFEFGKDIHQYRIYPDLTGVDALKGDLDKKATTMKTFALMGYPPNVLAKFMNIYGLPTNVEGLDTGYIQSNMIPVTALEKLADMPPQPASIPKPLQYNGMDNNSQIPGAGAKREENINDANAEDAEDAEDTTSSTKPAKPAKPKKTAKPAPGEEADNISKAEKKMYEGLENLLSHLSFEGYEKKDINSGSYDLDDGSMICWYPPSPLAKKFALDKGVDSDSLHVTLMCLSELYDEDSLADLLHGFCSEYSAKPGRIGGIGRFSQDKGDDVIYLNIDVPGLDKLRLDLLNRIESWGFADIKQDHGYTPHMTLGYVKHNDVNTITKVSTDKIIIDKLSLVVNGKRKDFKLSNNKDENIEL